MDDDHLDMPALLRSDVDEMEGTLVWPISRNQQRRQRLRSAIQAFKKLTDASGGQAHVASDHPSPRCASCGE